MQPQPNETDDNALNRRAYLGGAVGVAAVGLAGCTERIPFIGDEPIEFSAAVAVVPGPSLEETGYEEQAVEQIAIEETMEVGDRSQAVLVTNWQAAYEKSIDTGPLGLVGEGEMQAAVFTALCTPQVNVLGRTFNPVADMSSAELAEMVQEQYSGIRDLEQIGDEPATVSGESTTVGEFEGEAELVEAGATVDVTLHIAEAVPASEDLIVGVGGYPTTHEGERDNIFRLLEAIEYDP